MITLLLHGHIWQANCSRFPLRIQRDNPILNLLLRGNFGLKGAEKVLFRRLLKNAQMQGLRNPEERGVLGRTPQRRRMRETPQMGVYQRPISASVSLRRRDGQSK